MSKKKEAVAEEETEGAEGEEQDEKKGAESEGEETDPALADAQEIARLKKENEELKARPAAPAPVTTNAPKVTAVQLRGMGEAQRKELEQRFGVPFEDIVREVENHEIRGENADVKSRLNIQDALEDAQASDPKVHALKVHMKSYLQRLPLDVRADPARLKEEIAHAKTYAKGKLSESGGAPAITRAPGKGGKMKGNLDPAPDMGGDEDDDAPEGAVKTGAEFVSKDGSFKLKVGVGDRISAETRKKIVHPDDPNGAMFGREEEPRFDRG